MSSDDFAWRPRLDVDELRVLDHALGVYLDAWEGHWNNEAILAEKLLERVRLARVEAEPDPEERMRMLDGKR
jgi:hypothetical protein